MKIAQSMRWRLQLWHGALLAAVTSGLLVSFWHFRKSQLEGEIDGRLQQAMLYAMPQFVPQRARPPDAPPPPPDQEDEEFRRRDEVSKRLERESIYYAVFRGNGLRQTSDYGPRDLPAPAVRPPGSQSILRSREGVRELLHSGPRATLVILGLSTEEMTRHLQKLAWQLAGGGAAIVTLAMLAGAWITRRALRPVQAISTTAAEIAGGKLSQRIDVAETESELGQLAGVLNHTFDRLQQNLEQQVRFTADASHELRTPLSVILSKTQLALRAERSPEEYRETLASCERAARRMKDLVHSLLELARLDGGDGRMEMQPCDLSALAAEAVDEMRVLTPGHTVVLKAGAPVMVNGDPPRFGQVLINLIANAAQHTPEGSTVTVQCAAEGHDAVLRVTDNGPGIPADSLPHLFERFYRVDKARSRAAGGSGLGLAIAHAIVTAHQGTLTGNSPPAGGAVFTVRLPLADPKP